jgi:hypothetical protein
MNLLGERDGDASVVAAEEPPDLQKNEYLLAAGGGIGQPPLIPAMYPDGPHAARRAIRPGAACPGLDPHRLPRREDPLDHKTGQLREHDAENLEIALPA